MTKIEWDVRLTFNNIMVALVSLPLIFGIYGFIISIDYNCFR